MRFVPLVVIAALVWFLFVSEKGAEWLTKYVAKDDHRGPVVGKVISASGPFKRVHSGIVDEYAAELPEPLAIYDGNRIETPKGTSVQIVLNSTDELELGELTAVTVQLWNPRDVNSPVYVQWMAGMVTSRKAGPRGRAYLVRDGRLFFPGQKALEKPLALTVLRTAPVDMQLADAGGSAGEDFEADGPSTAEEALGENEPPPDFTAEPITLSNEYIDEMMVSRQNQLQKCWLTQLKERPNQKGRMLLQFEISRRGKVRDLRIADSSLNDEALKRCVISVVERLTFRSYKGQEISLSYPISFE